MAITVGAQAGRGPYSVGEAVTPLYFGASASHAFSGSAVTVTLPTDANSGIYGAYRIAAGAAAYWWGFGTAATVGGANCFLIPSHSFYDVVPPAGATTISVIADTGETAGSICVIGLY